MLPTPVLRLLNVLDGDYLESEEGYEGQCYLRWVFTSSLRGLLGTSLPRILRASASVQWGYWILWLKMLLFSGSRYRVCPPESSCSKALFPNVIVFGIGASFGKSEGRWHAAGRAWVTVGVSAELHLSPSGVGWGWGWEAARDLAKGRCGVFREWPAVWCGCIVGYLLGSSQFAVLKDLNFIPEVAALEHKLAQSFGSGPERSLSIGEWGRSHYRCQGGGPQTYASVQAFWKHSGEGLTRARLKMSFSLWTARPLQAGLSYHLFPGK